MGQLGVAAGRPPEALHHEGTPWSSSVSRTVLFKHCVRGRGRREMNGSGIFTEAQFLGLCVSLHFKQIRIYGEKPGH